MGICPYMDVDNPNIVNYLYRGGRLPRPSNCSQDWLANLHDLQQNVNSMSYNATFLGLPSFLDAGYGMKLIAMISRVL